MTVRHIDAAGNARKCEQFEASVSEDALQELALELSVSVNALRRLGIGWCGWGWTFPMRDATGAVRGFRVRRPDGSKLSIKGSRDGLFVPRGSDSGGPLFVAEGLTDTAALLDLDLRAVGRPSNLGGLTQLRHFVRDHQADEVVIVADNDDAGASGGRTTAMGVAAYAPRVTWIQPPSGCKDARDWKSAGARREDLLLAAAESEPVRVLVVRGHARRAR